MPLQRERLLAALGIPYLPRLVITAADDPPPVRAERDTVALAARETINPLAIKFLNRLSDHLFVLARTLNDGGRGDILWRPGANR